jgi:hypothetical protein
MTASVRFLVALSLALAIVGATAHATAAVPAEYPTSIDVASQEEDGGGSNGTSGGDQLPATKPDPGESDSHAGELFALIVAVTLALAAGGIWRWRATNARVERI